MNKKLWKILQLCSVAVIAIGILWFSVTREAQAADLQQTPNCSVKYDKTATPGEVDAGGVVTVSLWVQATGNCSAQNSPVDILLVIDRSGSMSGRSLRDAKAAAIGFVGQMDLTVDQVGIASFSRASRLDHPLSQNATSVSTAINRLSPGGSTNIEQGLTVAETELGRSSRKALNAPMIIVVSDGHHNATSDSSLYAAADRIKRSGVRIISIGLGANANASQLRRIASSVNDYYYAPQSSQLVALYQSISGTVRVAARNMVITDTLSNAVNLIAGSFQGAVLPSVDNNRLIWNLQAVPTAGISLSYQVAMTGQAGDWPTNDSAIATYINADGNTDGLTFPVPIVKVRSLCGAPTLTDVQPAWACFGSDTPLDIFGGGFFEPSVFADSTQLSRQSWETSGISATIPSSLAPDKYDVSVTQCDASSGGPYTNLLTDALRIYSNDAPILAVRPKEGYTDLPTELTICGPEGFPPGSIASIELPTGTLTLENQSIVSEFCMIGTLPAGPEDSSWKGLHKVTVTTACGTTPESRVGTYRLLPADLNDDLWGRSQELWIDPSVVAYANEDIKIGQIVHRRGGKNPIQNLKVRFWEGEPLTGVQIGDGTIPLLSPRVEPNERISGTSTSAVGWIPSRGQGKYTLYAVIDPDNKVVEDIEDNNVISRTVIVAPPASPDQDQVAPVVTVFKLGNGTDQVDNVYDTEVTMQVNAEDFAQQNVTPAGIDQLYFVEYLFNQAAGIWEPVQTSGWQPFGANWDWSLVAQGGLRYMQAWVSDKVGNVTRYPYVQRFNYIRPCEAVGRNGTRTYQQDLQAGDILEVQVTPCSGDPDLYIWPPDWDTDGRPPWVSNQEHEATEYISMTVPVDGVYQVEVYGFTPSRFDIQMDAHTGVVAAADISAASAGDVVHVNAAKQAPTEPVLPANSAPLLIAGNPPEPVEVTPQEPNFSIYLPMSTR